MQKFVKLFEEFLTESSSTDAKMQAAIQDFVDKDWEKAYDLCKKLGTKPPLSRQIIRQQRPGYVSMWLWDFYRNGKLKDTDLV